MDTAAEALPLYVLPAEGDAMTDDRHNHAPVNAAIAAYNRRPSDRIRARKVVYHLRRHLDAHGIPVPIVALALADRQGIGELLTLSSDAHRADRLARGDTMDA